MYGRHVISGAKSADLMQASVISASPDPPAHVLRAPSWRPSAIQFRSEKSDLLKNTRSFA
jgi:hypothetical protein